MEKEFILSDFIGYDEDFKDDEHSGHVIVAERVEEFIKRRESRLRNQIRIHWNWLRMKSSKEVADFIVTIANKELGDKFK